ncbi:MAG: Endo-1,4-beta-xylanase [candidate division BRC1 bacterium ADurb.BinA364]|nr:MAG: Endo-1,4-beta-xylanase [candidate division BRC1 bacterium ADurb.BinA364]
MFERSVVLPAIALAAIAGFAQGAAMDEDEILGGAEARIREHRMAGAELALADSAGRPLPEGTLARIEQTRHAFLFGVCTQWLFHIFSEENRFETRPEAARLYSDRFVELFNFGTTQVYWGGYEREPGRPQYDLTQANCDWAKRHGIALKGHPLVWNNIGAPRWIAAMETDRAVEAQARRLEEVMKRFQGQIAMWDVVNEAAAYEREDAWKANPVLTKAMQEMGVEAFVRLMYERARQADPSALLLTNDYVLDERYEKRGIAPLLDSEGALFDIVGIQSHMHAAPWTPRKIWDVCERFAKYGKPIHFTETTIPSGDPDGRRRSQQERGYRWLTTAEGEARQAREVELFYTILFSHPAVEAITWWSLTDDQAWLGAPAGLLRADMSPKPAYGALRRLIKGKWWTTLETHASAGGRVDFRGFLGDYRILAETSDGRRLQGRFSLAKDSPSPIPIVLRPAP